MSRTIRNSMFREIREIIDGTGALLLDRLNDVLSILIGGYAENYTIEQMENIWVISGKHINLMYGQNLRLRKGIG